MSLQDLRRIKWGDVAPIPEPGHNESKALSTTVSDVLVANPNRVQCYLSNPSAIAVYLRWGDEAPTSNLGYPLPAGGEKVFTFEEDGSRIFQRLRALAASGTPTIFVASDVMSAPRLTRTV